MSESKCDLLEYKKEKMIQVLRLVEQILISLDHIGACYPDVDQRTFNNLLANFICDWKVMPKLAEVRSILSEKFSDELGDDDMDELERELKDIKYWSINNQKP